jgi:hypothetical protein
MNFGDSNIAKSQIFSRTPTNPLLPGGGRGRSRVEDRGQGVVNNHEYLTEHL